MILSDQPSRIASRSMVRHVELYFSLMESISFLMADGRVARGRLMIPFDRGTEDTEKWVRYVVIRMMGGTYTCGVERLLGHCLFCRLLPRGSVRSEVYMWVGERSRAYFSGH